MDTTRINYSRAAALLWWKNLTLSNKKAYSKQWQDSIPEYGFKKEWTFEMIYYSDSTIQQVFEYINALK